MEFKIECDNYVMLYALESVLECESIIDSYVLENDSLKGNVQIIGKYLKTDEDVPIEFKDNFPYTIVFSTKNVNVNEIKVDNFTYVVSGEGINCTFDVVVNYDEIETLVKTDGEITSNNEEYDEITKEYEKKLAEALNRNDNLEEKTVDEVPFYLKLNERQTRIKVFYYKDDKELDKISKNSDESIQELLERSEMIGDYRRIIIKS